MPLQTFRQKCTSCYPLSKENCHNYVSDNGKRKLQQNKLDAFDFEEENTDDFPYSQNLVDERRQNGIEKNEQQSTERVQHHFEADSSTLDFMNRKMKTAFGATLLNADDHDPEDKWVKI